MSEQQLKVFVIAYDRDLAIIKFGFFDRKEAESAAKNGWIGVVVYREGGKCFAYVYRDGMPTGHRIEVSRNFFVYSNDQAVLRRDQFSAAKVCGDE